MKYPILNSMLQLIIEEIGEEDCEGFPSTIEEWLEQGGQTHHECGENVTAEHCEAAEQFFLNCTSDECEAAAMGEDTVEAECPHLEERDGYENAMRIFREWSGA